MAAANNSGRSGFPRSVLCNRRNNGQEVHETDSYLIDASGMSCVALPQFLILLRNGVKTRLALQVSAKRRGDN